MSTDINTIDDIKRFFAEDDTEYLFISATNFNLMNMEKWVKNWTSVNFINCYDNGNPDIFVPSTSGAPVLDSIESINSFLLGHKELVEKIGNSNINEDNHGKAVFLFFDEDIEAVCKAMHLDICLPSNRLVKQIDNKITTTEIGNEAGVPSVPNALEHVDSYETLMKIAKDKGLGDSLVVQTAYGDSGKTTFFINNEDDYNAVSDQIICEEKVKIMKCIRCAGTAIEGCATRAGTFVAPLLSELIGFEELTPYKGGWCGNELYQEVFSDDIRKQAASMTEKLGNALYARGYRGYFEVDYLIDLDNGDVYLGELNPRITGISAMTNMSDFSCQQVPLFLFHLLEYTDSDKINLNISPEEYNQQALQTGAKTVSSQLIFKYIDKNMKIITKAPVSGVYQLSADGNLQLQAPGFDRREALANDQVFIKRIMSEDEYAYKGGDIAIAFCNSVLKNSDQSLSTDASIIIKAVHQLFSYRDLTEEEQAIVERYNAHSSLKGTAISETES